MKKNDPIKKALNKFYLPYCKITAFWLFFNYDSDTSTISPHYARSEICWAIESALKDKVDKERLDLICKLVMDELYTQVYSEEVQNMVLEFLKATPENLLDFLKLQEPLYKKSIEEAFDKCSKSSLNTFKKIILDVIYKVLLVYYPEYGIP